MTSKLLLRIASVIMFLRLIGQLLVAYKIPFDMNKMQDYLWQHSDLAHNHEFFYWGFIIVFGVVSRLLWLISETNDKLESLAASLLEPAFFFLLAFGVEEFVFQYYYTGSITILSAILVAISYFKMKGMSIKITYDHNKEE